jgi:hypothetical protein
VQSYNEDGTVAAVMQGKPHDLFERVFGSVTAGVAARAEFVGPAMPRGCCR